MQYGLIDVRTLNDHDGWTVGVARGCHKEYCTVGQ
jgi:hypothetical protein